MATPTARRSQRCHVCAKRRPSLASARLDSFPISLYAHAPVHNELTVPWHFVFESLAYFVAFRLYLMERRKTGDFLNTSTRWTVVVAAIGGAAIGSKVLFWFEDPTRTFEHWNSLEYLLSGK